MWVLHLELSETTPNYLKTRKERFKALVDVDEYGKYDQNFNQPRLIVGHVLSASTCPQRSVSVYRHLTEIPSATWSVGRDVRVTRQSSRPDTLAALPSAGYSQPSCILQQT